MSLALSPSADPMIRFTVDRREVRVVETLVQAVGALQTLDSLPSMDRAALAITASSTEGQVRPHNPPQPPPTQPSCLVLVPCSSCLIHQGTSAPRDTLLASKREHTHTNPTSSHPPPPHPSPVTPVPRPTAARQWWHAHPERRCSRKVHVR